MPSAPVDNKSTCEQHSVNSRSGKHEFLRQIYKIAVCVARESVLDGLVAAIEVNGYITCQKLGEGKGGADRIIVHPLTGHLGNGDVSLFVREHHGINLVLQLCRRCFGRCLHLNPRKSVTPILKF